MDSPQVDGMPITGVTLYDNGYAVFERETTVQGHGSIDLYFSSRNMPNVLESLHFLGEGGKKVGNISYEATKPTASINLDQREPLVGLIRSLVGGLISVQYMAENGLETIEGRILGVDEKLQDPETKTKMEHVSILLEGGVMRTLPIKSIHSFHIPESQVQQDLAFSLDLVRNRSKDNSIHACIACMLHTKYLHCESEMYVTWHDKHIAMCWQSVSLVGLSDYTATTKTSTSLNSCCKF